VSFLVCKVVAWFGGAVVGGSAMLGDEPTRGERGDDLDVMLGLVAGGDVSAFSRLYDRLASASYAVCVLLGKPKEDHAMHKTWLYVWANAASLREMNIPTRTLVLNIAQEMATAST
jgi:hypothetical protein